MILDKGDATVVFEGNATLRWRSGMTMRADRIKSRAQTKEVWADGHVLVRYEAKSDEIDCSSHYYNYGTASTMRVHGGIMRYGGAKIKAHAPPTGPILVRLVAADMPDRLISDLETVAAVEDPSVSRGLRQTGPARSLGLDATLWVESARVDGTNTLARFYQGVLTHRKAELEFDPGALGWASM
jgi:hypothetical protein